MALKIEPDTVIPPLPSTERGRGIHIDGTLKKAPRILYCCNNLVLYRNLEDWNKCFINPDSHSKKARVAKFNLNAEFIASGDETGQWDIYGDSMGADGRIKSSYDDGMKPKACKSINDIAFDGQLKKNDMQILLVGNGKEELSNYVRIFALSVSYKYKLIIIILINRKGRRCVACKGGNAQTLMGTSKNLLSCDYTQGTDRKHFKKLYRICAGGEDNTVYLYGENPAKSGIKLITKNSVHKNYVNATRFSPDFSQFVSVSSDKKIIVWNSEDGKILKTLTDGKGKTDHKGSIYSVSYSPDGKRILTASADKTCKVFNIESGECEFTYKFADKPTKADMQVSCLWLSDKYMFSVSLNGRINILDPEMKQERPLRIVTGHRRAINDIAYDSDKNILYTVDSESQVVKTECKTMDPVDVSGDPHKETQIRFIRTTKDNKAFYTIAVNDTLCKTDIVDEEKGGDCSMGDKTIKLDGAARGCATGNKDTSLFIVATHKKSLYFINDLAITKTVTTKAAATCLELSKDDSMVIIGTGRDGDNSVLIYDTKDPSKPLIEIKNQQYIRNEIVDVAITDDNAFLATADKDRAIWIWDLKNKKFDEPLNRAKGMKFHNGQISNIVFGGKDGKQLLSCANDSKIYLWLNPTEGGNENICMNRAFIGLVKKAIFISETKIAAIGGDSTIRTFNISPK